MGRTGIKRLLLWVAALGLVLSALLFPAAAKAPVGVPLSKVDKEALLSALFEAEITDVREAIDLRLITCRELTAYYLERIEAYDDEYNCFITLCGDAMEQARLRDEQLAAGEGGGALFGIPVVVKDNIHYAGYPTTNGRSSRLKTVSESNAVIVDYLLAEGAVILGKTNMSTDAQNARVSKSSAGGETKNAYNHYLASGGSSGGSAVAVSLNFAMAGLGTDTNCSLRYPSALNGCVSLRPTLGTLSTEGILPLNTTRDAPGAITRTVRDQAIMLDVLSGGGTAYAENLDDTVLEGMRIGVLKELSYPVAGSAARSAGRFDTEIRAAFDNALGELEACGAEIVEVSFRQVFTLATTSSDNSATKRQMYSDFQALLADYELSVVVFPTYSSAPQWSGTDADGTVWSVNSQNYINNCTSLSSFIGTPEITVPIGRHSRGAGIGMEIAGDKNAEQLLLNVAYSYTQRYDHREVPEGAADLYAQANAGDVAARIAAYQESPLPPVIQNLPLALTSEPAPEPTPEPAPEPTPEPTPQPTPEPTPAPEETAPPEGADAREEEPVWLWAIAAAGAVIVVIAAGTAAVLTRGRRRHNAAGEEQPVGGQRETVPGAAGQKDGEKAARP